MFSLMEQFITLVDKIEKTDTKGRLTKFTSLSVLSKIKGIHCTARKGRHGANNWDMHPNVIFICTKGLGLHVNTKKTLNKCT